MMKFNFLNIFKFILIIVWMLSVFGFSSEIGEESSDTSGNIIRKVVCTFNSKIEDKELDNIVENLQFFVRKVAHYILYAIGGFLIYNFIKDINKPTLNKIKYSFLIGFAYSVSDEIHQMFVPGRASRVTDVLIDSLGVMTGIIIYIALQNVLGKIYKAIKKCFKIKCT